ncbi:MAG: c-type cytochrome [Gammaproteobacteria bacterium]|nr:c-type cytochrome [Gammaproteobacteria bacterium]
MFIVMASLCIIAMANADEGETLFHIQCIGCHHFGSHAVGPDLCGLAGRKAGTATGYSYSRAMQDYSVRWNKDSLEYYLESPMTIVPGTKMGIIGFDDKHDREALANYVIERSRSRECL